MASGWTDPRPMSPHLQVWRWHITMATSIFHRATGVANYLGMILVTAWLVSIAAGPEAYEAAEAVLLSWFGKLVMFGMTLSITYHLANGLRHLFWDVGAGFTPSVANAASWFVFIFTAAATAVIWIFGYGLLGGAS